MYVRPTLAEPNVLPRRRITVTLLCCVIALSLLSLAGQISAYVFGHPFLMGAVPLFYVDLEGNVPTWYQSTVFTFGAILTFIIHVSERRRNSAFATHWLVLAILLVAMSVDETSQIHELTMEPLARWIGRLQGAWRPMWVILGLTAVVVVSLSYLRFFFYLDRSERMQVSLAAGLFVGGAIGVEMATATMYEVYHPSMKLSLSYAVMAHVEEVCEMLGLVTFIDFLLQRVSRLGCVSMVVNGPRQEGNPPALHTTSM